MPELRDRFTEAEWLRLRELPSRIVACAATVEHDGGLSSARELMAGLHAILYGGQVLRDNPLVQAVFDDYKREGQGEALTLALSQAPPPDLRQQTLDDAALAGAMAWRLAPEDAEIFAVWLLSLAEDVTAAATTGGFLGFGGRRVTSAESAFLDALSAALGIRQDVPSSEDGGAADAPANIEQPAGPTSASG